LQRAGEWDEAGCMLAHAAHALESAGAQGLVLCTNTMHKVAAAIEGAVDIPLLHIADPTAAQIKRQGLRKVGLLGTRFTMEQDFYRDRVEGKYGIEVIVPEAADRDIVHRVIYEELCLGKIDDASRMEYRRIIRKLADSGAEGIILGCTEISLLVEAGDSPVPLFDTTAVHASSAAGWALGDAA
jgi:aspartate racemase